MEELCSVERGSGVHQRRKKERRDVQSATTNFDEVSRELNCSFELICVMDDIVVGVYGVVRLLEVGGVEFMGGEESPVCLAWAERLHHHRPSPPLSVMFHECL